MTRQSHIEAIAEALDPPVWARAGDELKETFRRRATAAISALEKIGAYVPEGWVAVPSEPTEDMLKMGLEAYRTQPAINDITHVDFIFSRMLSAKPAQGKE